MSRSYDKTNPEHIKRNKEYQRQWYLKNKKIQIARTQEQKKKLTRWFKEYKTTLECELCGENHPACLDFHHRDPTQKLFAVSNYMSICSKEKILLEISKCQILCANCHRKLHANQCQLDVLHST